MSKVELNLISVEEAKELNDKLKGLGTPTGSRVLIVSPIVTADTKTRVDYISLRNTTKIQYHAKEWSFK